MRRRPLRTFVPTHHSMVVVLKPVLEGWGWAFVTRTGVPSYCVSCAMMMSEGAACALGH